MKVDVRCVARPDGGVRIETPAHVSRGTGAPYWVAIIEIPPDETESFINDFITATGFPVVFKAVKR